MTKRRRQFRSTITVVEGWKVVAIGACATVLCTAPAWGTQTAREKCDQARVTAWKTYVACIDTVVAKNAGCATTGCPLSFKWDVSFSNCRHAYFKNWAAFQTKAALAGSTCIGTRFTSTDSGLTVTDGLTGLVWEEKTNLDGIANYGNPQDADNPYSWSTAGPSKEDGTAFTSFLETINGGGGFAGANGWRLPTLAELQTIVLDFPCTKTSCSCSANPCIDSTFGPTLAYSYWSATSLVPGPGLTWAVYFSQGNVIFLDVGIQAYVRAVRGGL